MLDQFWHRFWELNSTHNELWRTYNLYFVTKYTDSRIIENRGSEAYNEVYSLYEHWIELRRSIERFLESKYLPTEYPTCVWTRPYVGASTHSSNYDGGPGKSSFDGGPADWCAVALNGMTLEMHNRLHLQRIESYSLWGFIAGVSGLVIGVLGLVC